MVEDLRVSRFYIKTPVFPFMKFPGSDILLGPEMKSTGEVMGISEDFGIAFAKAQAAAGNTIPTEGTAFLSVNDRDKRGLLPHARGLHETGFHILATQGTAEFLNEHGVPAELVFKVNEGRPNIVDRIKSGGIQLIINTPLGRESFHDDGAIRTNALLHGVLCVTTLTAAAATVQAIRALRLHTLTVSALQELHPVPISTPVPADPAPAPSPPNPAIPLTTGAA